MRRDAKLASPLILDFVLITQLMQRIEVLSLSTPSIAKSSALENLLRALVGLYAEISRLLECKIRQIAWSVIWTRAASREKTADFSETDLENMVFEAATAAVRT